MQPPVLRPFDDAAVEGIRMLLTTFPLGEAQSQLARESYRTHGRGLFLHLARDGTVGSMQPPSYIAVADWLRNPLVLLPAMVIERISSALRQYDPQQASVHLVVASNPDDPAAGNYAWFQAPLLANGTPAPVNTSRPPRGRPRR